jgi:hypothetical protein
MAKNIKYKSAEKAANAAERANKTMKQYWNMTRSINIAKSTAGRKQIYRLPNGTYIWRK